ncbi:PP2C family protein-serine/threonine phosphatase [Glycomyces sp. NPDC047010]|uniref:PP2C family protein-serine/threonine phosphatase n=1 Tax=Glycomyces sp. NPDC047010 TaxID=3155023 RepID=UPI00340EE123
MERLPQMLTLRKTVGLAWLRALPLVLVIVMVPVELATSSVHLWTLIAALPPLAALVNGPRTTVVVAVTALLACAALNWSRISGGVADGYSEMVPVVLIGATSVVIAVLRDRVIASLINVNAVSEAAQRALLPDLPRRIGRLECAARYRAAAADSRLGGDFFDLLDTQWGVRAVLGDVSGHGLGAVATMAALLGSFREGALDDVDLNALSVRMERRMLMCNERRGGWTEEFATALLMAFARDGCTVEVRSFGHHPPLLVRGNEVEALSLTPAPPLGLVGEMNVAARSVGRALHPGDLLVAFTDGVVEARDRAGGMYPFEERLRDRAGAEPFANAAAVVEFLFADLETHGFRLTDDTAVLVVGVRREP